MIQLFFKRKYVYILIVFSMLFIAVFFLCPNKREIVMLFETQLKTDDIINKILPDYLIVNNVYKKNSLLSLHISSKDITIDKLEHSIEKRLNKYNSILDQQLDILNKDQNNIIKNIDEKTMFYDKNRSQNELDLNLNLEKIEELQQKTKEIAKDIQNTDTIIKNFKTTSHNDSKEFERLTKMLGRLNIMRSAIRKNENEKFKFLLEDRINFLVEKINKKISEDYEDHQIRSASEYILQKELLQQQFNELEKNTDALQKKQEELINNNKKLEEFLLEINTLKNSLEQIKKNITLTKKNKDISFLSARKNSRKNIYAFIAILLSSFSVSLLCIYVTDKKTKIKSRNDIIYFTGINNIIEIKDMNKIYSNNGESS